MERGFDKRGHEDLETSFERVAGDDDGAAARALWAAGLPIHVARRDTPAGHVVRIFPDGREEIVAVNREAAARTLGG